MLALDCRQILHHGGDLVSTGVKKRTLRAAGPGHRVKKAGTALTADNNYALAA